jgi:hypothetical protein
MPRFVGGDRRVHRGTPRPPATAAGPGVLGRSPESAPRRPPFFKSIFPSRKVGPRRGRNRARPAAVRRGQVGPGEKLTCRQERAVLALLTERTIARAAAKAKADRASAHGFPSITANTPRASPHAAPASRPRRRSHKPPWPTPCPAAGPRHGRAGMKAMPAEQPREVKDLAGEGGLGEGGRELHGLASSSPFSVNSVIL